MPTQQQIQAAEVAKKKQKQALVASVATLPYSFKSAGTGLGWGAVVELVGALGIGAWQFFTGKKFSKKIQKQQEAIQATHATVEEALGRLNNEGLDLIDLGMQPGTTAFEEKLREKLYHVMGYKGMCNADFWVPGTINQARKPGRPIQFYVTNNGAKLTPVGNFRAHPFLQSYWSAQCKNIRDGWAEAYQQKLIAEGRFAELEKLESEINKGKLIIRLVMGGSAIILLLMIATYSFKMEN